MPEVIDAQQRGLNYWGLRGSVRQLDGTMVSLLNSEVKKDIKSILYKLQVVNILMKQLFFFIILCTVR